MLKSRRDLHHCSIFSNVKPKVQCIICCFQSLFPRLPLPSPSNTTVLIFDSCVSEEDTNRIHRQENFGKLPSISLYRTEMIFISILSEKIRSCCESAFAFKKPPGCRLPALVLYNRGKKGRVYITVPYLTWKKSHAHLCIHMQIILI